MPVIKALTHNKGTGDIVQDFGLTYFRSAESGVSDRNYNLFLFTPGARQSDTDAQNSVDRI
jgi:hypothetical protein